MTDYERKELAQLHHKWGCSDITPEQIRRMEELEAREVRTCSRCGVTIPLDCINARLCDDCEHEDRAEELAPKWEPDFP